VSQRRGVFLVLLLIILALAVSAGGLLLLLLATGGAPPTVSPNTTLYLKLQAPWNEIEPLDVFSQFVGQPRTLRGAIDEIKRAKADERIKTLVILPQASGAMWAQLQDLRAALVDFKTSGKPVTAYMEYAGVQEYYLATAADRILMMPGGTLDVAGLATYELFLRGGLDKIGVYPDLLHIGDYKTASNTFTEKGFTPAHREMSRSLNRDWFDQLVGATAEGRKRSAADIVRAIDGGPYMAEGAVTAGLIDAVAYEDQIDDDPPVRGTRRMEGDTYTKVPGPVSGSAAAGRIALLYGVGTIASGGSSFDGTSGAVLGSDTFVQWVRKVRSDASVKAIVVRIDSPGGSAIASEVMWRELMLTREMKPLVVSMGDVAASGGYYIALPAHTIVAEPGTITGSIGVVTGKFVLKDAFAKLGIGTDAVSDGRMAEINSPFRPFSAAERARMEEQMQATYDVFVAHVAEGRHTTAAKVDAIARGRVWTGRQAHELGLVDELGGLDTAIRIAKERAKLDPKRDVPLLVYPPKRGLFDVLTNPLGTSLEVSVGALFRRPEARLIDTVTRAFRLFRRGEPLALMPNLFWN
jgi:protease-4